MWKCSACNEVSESQFDACWNCGTAKDEHSEVVNSTTSGQSMTETASGPPYMTLLDLADLLVKGFAFVGFAFAIYLSFISVSSYFLVVSRNYPGEFLGFTWDGPSMIGILILGSPLLLLLFFSYAILTSSRRIGGILIPQSRQEVAVPRIRVDEVQAFVFSTVGLILILTAIRQLSSVIVVQLMYDTELWELPDFVVLLVTIIFGLWLLLGSRGFVRAIKWLRYAGTPHFESEFSDSPMSDKSVAEQTSSN